MSEREIMSSPIDPVPVLASIEARRRRFVRYQRVWFSAVLALLLVLAGLPLGLALLPRSAEASQAVRLSVGSFVYYDGARTCYLDIDGQMAYCMDPQLPTPAAGSYSTVQELSPANPANKETLRAAAWFSFGGPGFDKAMWPAKWYDGTPMNDGRYVVLGHLLVSQLYTSSERHATAGCGAEFISWAKREVLGWDKGEVINPDATRLKVEAAERSVPASFKAFQVPTGSGTQTLISFTYNPVGDIALQKASAAPALTDGNPLYSLKNATYGVFSDASCRTKVGAIVTDSGGCGALRGLAVGRYYVKETAAPAGYALDNAVYEVDVRDGAEAMVNGGVVKDVPQTSPIGALIEKHDAQFAVGSGQPQGDASLAGAQFTVRHFGALFDTAEAAEASGAPLATWVFETDSDGIARFFEEAKVSGPAVYANSSGASALSLGTYLVQETRAPSGYQLNDDVIVLKVASSGSAELLAKTTAAALPEEVVRGGISLQKVDAETESGQPLGRAQLENTQFEIKNASAHDVVVAGERFAPGEVVTTLACDSQGRASTAADLLPFGTYEVYETQPGLGYLFGGAQTQTVAVRQEGIVSVDVSGAPLLFQNQVVRGDLEFVKARESDMGRLAGIPFLITSLTTGEAHVAVTDENGQFKSADEWNSHSQRTNGNDAALQGDGSVDEELLDASCGIWFGTFGDGQMCPAASRGALPFDRYSLQELPVAANRGLQLVSIPSISVTRDSVAVDLGTLDDSDEPGTPEPEIFTRARAENGTAVSAAVTSTALTDRVSYGGLQPGETYFLTAQLVNRRTGEFLYQEGLPLSAQISFVPEGESGEVEISVPLNTAQLGDEAEVVFYETLAKGSESEVVALHQDINNSYQTVAVAHPLLRTTLVGPDGQKSLVAEGECVLVDTVEYEGLEPGRTYRLEGQLMRKMAGEGIEVDAQPLKNADGALVVAQAEFVPEGSGGTATVEFRFDTSVLDGPLELVAFERLSEGDQVVASHEDATDARQTVSLVPPEPQAPSVPDKPAAGPLPKTGDDAMPLGMGVLTVVSAAALVVLGVCFGRKASEHFRKRL